MKLDKLSKECVIIGFISFVFILLLITIEAEELIRILQSNYIGSEENRSRYLKGHYLKIATYVAAALASILIIFGITKRRASLMAPWLLAAFGGVAFSAYYNVISLIYIRYDHLEFLIYMISIIGLESIVLYPLCTLFAEIRRERANKLKCLAQNEGVTIKI